MNALNREGRERLVAAFEEVNRNFASLFTQLPVFYPNVTNPAWSAGLQLMVGDS